MQNFETTQYFIQSLEYLSPSLQSVNKMRAHPSYSAFERRWQLPVYFQLRWKEIVGKVEERLQSTSLSPSATKTVINADFTLSQSEAIWNAICECWSTDIFLRDLGHRFWRLTLQVSSIIYDQEGCLNLYNQLLRRYRTWLDKNLPMSDHGDKVKSSVAEKSAMTPLGTPRAPTPAMQDNQSAETTAEEDKTLYQCSILICDIREMNARVFDFWKEEISAMLPFGASEGDGAERSESMPTLVSHYDSLIYVSLQTS